MHFQIVFGLQGTVLTVPKSFTDSLLDLSLHTGFLVAQKGQFNSLKHHFGFLPQDPSDKDLSVLLVPDYLLPLCKPSLPLRVIPPGERVGKDKPRLPLALSQPHISLFGSFDQ